uniref:PLAC8 family protein n=1 Tax=Arcella intermedia TaxID=1963864 RepID=A0A6B2LSM4_9EUKA
MAVSFCCAPCQGAYQKAASEDRDCTIVDGLMFMLCGPVCFVITRSQIREKFGYEGSFCGDILAVWCCALCAISQHTRVLDIKGRKPAGMFMEGDRLLG